MDPNACVTRLEDVLNDGDYLEARLAADDLYDWLRLGGFQPTNWDDNPKAADYFAVAGRWHSCRK